MKGKPLSVFLFAMAIIPSLAAQDKLLAQLVDRRRLDDVKALLESGRNPNGANDEERQGIESSLLKAPPEYFRLLLDRGFNPNLIDTRGRYDPEGGRSALTRGSFIYKIICSGRTEFLPFLKPTNNALAARNATIVWQRKNLVRLRVETLADAAKRMGDGDSLAFLASLNTVTREAFEGPLGDVTGATVNDDNVRVRSGPGTGFPAVDKLTRGQKVNVVQSGPPRFLGDQPWMDRWFQIEAQGKVLGWTWGGFLDLPWVHGAKLDGPLLVDFMLWKQHLYDDVWDRASSSERWRSWHSLWEWAIPLQDKDFVRFLFQKKANDWVSLGEANESLIEKFLELGDGEGLQFWIDNGYQLTFDNAVSYGPQAFEGLLANPEADLFRLFQKGGYDFEALRGAILNNGGGDSWGLAENTASAILPRAPISTLLDLLPTWKKPNALFFTWLHSYAGYVHVRVWTLLDLAVERGDPRLIQAVKAQGGQDRQSVLTATPIVNGQITFQGAARRGNQPVAVTLPVATVNNTSVTILAQPAADAPVLQRLQKDEPVFLVDDTTSHALPGKEEPRWWYVMTRDRRFGWVAAEFLANKQAAGQ